MVMEDSPKESFVSVQIKEVPVEVIVEKLIEVEKIIHVPVVEIKEVEVIVEKVVEVEKIVEREVTVIKEVEVPVETKVIDVSRAFKAEQKLNEAMRTNKRLQVAVSIMMLVIVALMIY